jgi:hypothetical protein
VRPNRGHDKRSRRLRLVSWRASSTGWEARGIVSTRLARFRRPRFGSSGAKTRATWTREVLPDTCSFICLIDLTESRLRAPIGRSPLLPAGPEYSCRGILRYNDQTRSPFTSETSFDGPSIHGWVLLEGKRALVAPGCPTGNSRCRSSEGNKLSTNSYLGLKVVASSDGIRRVRDPSESLRAWRFAVRARQEGKDQKYGP